MSDQTTTKEVIAPGHEWYRKPLRTAIQLVMGGLLTTVVQWLLTQYGSGLSASGVAEVLGVATLATSAAQNYGESKGWLPTTLIPPAPTVTQVTSTTGGVKVVATALPPVPPPSPEPVTVKPVPVPEVSPPPPNPPDGSANDPAA